MSVLLVFSVIGIQKQLFIYLYSVLRFSYYGISVKNASLLRENLALFIPLGQYGGRRESREDAVCFGTCL